MLVEHTWTDNGTYPVTVTVTDGDGGRAEQVVATIVIRDVVLDAGPTVSGDEGAALAFDFTGSTASDSGLIYTVDWGDGRSEAWSGGPAQHRYASPGSYEVRLSAVDHSDGSKEYADTTTATVANLAPTRAAIAEHAVGRTGEPLGFRAYWTDPGGPDPATVISWSFGDGATASGRTAEHAYTAAGTYDVTVTVTEDDGKRVTRTDQVHVLADVDRTPSSAGREFWVTFDANYQGTEDSALTLFVASSTATSGVVEVPGLVEELPFTVAANDVTAVSLPIDVRAGVKDTNAQRVEPLAVHVVADDAVTVYGLNRQKYTTDAFLAVPVTAVGTRYRVVRLRVRPGTRGRRRGDRGPHHRHDRSPLPQLETHTVQLELGEVFEWETSTAQSMTGALITSDRPVSAYGANRCANIPSGYGYCDHIVEQLIPTSTWGRTFASMPLAGRTQDTFRVVADEDDTVVTTTDSEGSRDVTLDAGEFHEFLSGRPQSISGSKPISVAQYSNGSTFDSTVSDPFMVLVPALEQGYTSSAFSTPTSGFRVHHVNLTAPTAARGRRTTGRRDRAGRGVATDPRDDVLRRGHRHRGRHRPGDVTGPGGDGRLRLRPGRLVRLPRGLPAGAGGRGQPAEPRADGSLRSGRPRAVHDGPALGPGRRRDRRCARRRHHDRRRHRRALAGDRRRRQRDVLPDLADRGCRRGPRDVVRPDRGREPHLDRGAGQPAAGRDAGDAHHAAGHGPEDHAHRHRPRERRADVRRRDPARARHPHRVRRRPDLHAGHGLPTAPTPSPSPSPTPPTPRRRRRSRSRSSR